MTWQYIAGFFDGEGHVSIQRGSHSCRIIIGQSGKRGEAVLSLIRDWMTPQGIRSHVACKTPTIHQTAYRLEIFSRASGMVFLSNVLPFVHVKKVETQDMLRFLRMFPSMTPQSVGAKLLRYEGQQRGWETRRSRMAA